MRILPSNRGVRRRDGIAKRKIPELRKSGRRWGHAHEPLAARLSARGGGIGSYGVGRGGITGARMSVHGVVRCRNIGTAVRTLCARSGGGTRLCRRSRISLICNSPRCVVGQLRHPENSRVSVKANELHFAFKRESEWSPAARAPAPTPWAIQCAFLLCGSPVVFQSSDRPVMAFVCSAGDPGSPLRCVPDRAGHSGSGWRLPRFASTAVVF
jgi:hypothetical protein